MSSETDYPRQRTVAELLAEHGDSGAAGRRRRRRGPDGPEATGGWPTPPERQAPPPLPPRAVLREPVPREPGPYAAARDLAPREPAAPARRMEPPPPARPAAYGAPTYPPPPVYDPGDRPTELIPPVRDWDDRPRDPGPYDRRTPAPPVTRIDAFRPPPVEARPVVDDGPATGAWDGFDLDDEPAAGPAAPVGLAERPAAPERDRRDDIDDLDEFEDEFDEHDDEFDDLDDEFDDGDDADPDDAPDADGRRRGTGSAWAGVVAQWIAGALVGAVVWVGFRFLWRSLPVVALAAAVLVTVGLVLAIRHLLRNEERRTTWFAVLVGLLLTASPAVLALLGR